MIRRPITNLIKTSLQDFPVVLLNGSRQVGKSTVAKQLLEERVISQYVTLDDLATLQAAQFDPDAFVSQFDDSVAIDEIQRAPDLMRALKKNIDHEKKPGKFLLTGSANILSYPDVKESLAGRMDIIKLEGLSLGEQYQQNTPSTLIEDMFDLDIHSLAIKYRKKLSKRGKLNRQTLLQHIFFGGFPEVALKQKISFSDRWYKAYQAAYVEKDVRDLSRLLDVVLFRKLLQISALRTGNLLNIKNLAVDIGVDQRTVNRYLEMLSLTFQMNELTPWYSNINKRFIKTPKIYLEDSGFACHLAGIYSSDHLINHPMLGAIAETWVWAELRKLMVFSRSINVHFYRTHLGKEVDFVFVQGQAACGIEFKFSESISQKDFSGLTDFINTFGDKAKGILLYTGNQTLVFSDSLIAMPIASLV